MIEFTYSDGDRGVIISHTVVNDDISWSVAIREFHHFLLANGYSFEEGKIFDLVDGEYEW